MNRAELLTCQNALMEFINLRTPVKNYVSKRYGTHPTAFKAIKEETVLASITDAKNTLHTIEAELNRR